MGNYNRDEKVRMKEFMEEQNRLHEEYGFFFPIGTKILGKDEEGLLEIKGFLELEGMSYVKVENIKNKTIKVNERGESINRKRRKK